MPIDLHVDRAESLPIQAQLGEQIRYHIEAGAWEPGYRLPTVRFLAGSLGVNYNTVRAVYRDLEREGYVATRQGVGTYVANGPPKRPNQRERIEALIDSVLLEADRLGVTAEECARLSYLRAKMFRRGASHVPVLFLECSLVEAEFHAREIFDATGVRPTTALVQDLARLTPDFVDRFPVITTTLFHVTEAQKALGPGRQVHGLLVEPSTDQIVARLRPLARGSRVAIICSNRRNARKIQNALQRVGITHLRFSSVPIDAPAELRKAFRAADEIVVSRRILSDFRGAWPSKRRLLEYVDALSSASLGLLRRTIAEAAGLEAARPKAESAGRRVRGSSSANLKNSTKSRRGGATGGGGFARIS